MDNVPEDECVICSGCPVVALLAALLIHLLAVTHLMILGRASLASKLTLTTSNQFE